LASIQHVGVRLIVPLGEVSWKQPCSLTGAPPTMMMMTVEAQHNKAEGHLLERMTLTITEQFLPSGEGG